VLPGSGGALHAVAPSASVWCGCGHRVGPHCQGVTAGDLATELHRLCGRLRHLRAGDALAAWVVLADRVDEADGDRDLLGEIAADLLEAIDEAWLIEAGFGEPTRLVVLSAAAAQAGELVVVAA
jgi:hypothetical protein